VTVRKNATRTEVTGGWGILYNEDLQNLYPSVNLVRDLLKQYMYVYVYVRVDVRQTSPKIGVNIFRLGKFKEREHFKELGADWTVIIKLILNK
jgi:hypothetical protein